MIGARLQLAEPEGPEVEVLQFDEALESVVALSWSDLMPDTSEGLIHVEYHVEPLGSVEFVKVWASTVRGYWKLICTHWMKFDATHANGLRFSNQYHSDRLQRSLQSVMECQEIFRLAGPPGKNRLVQVHPPTDTDKAAASRVMGRFHDRLAL